MFQPVKSYMFLIQLLPILVCCAALMLQYVINIIECVRKGKLGYYEGNTVSFPAYTSLSFTQT